MTLFYVDPSCDVPALLYSPLIALCVIQVVFVLNEGLILVYSARGSIWKNTKARRHIIKLIYIRAVIAVLELIGLIVNTVGTWLPSSSIDIIACPGTTSSLHFAQAVVFFLWIVYFCFLLKVLVYVDPLGCFSPGLLEHISLLDGDKSSALEEGNGLLTTDGESMPSSVLTTRQISYWVSGRARLYRQVSGSAVAQTVPQRMAVHNNTISQTKMKRRIGALFCCLCVRDQRSMSGALEEVARGFYTVFGDTDNSAVLTDVIAGLRLVHYEQQRTQNLNDKFRKVFVW